MLLILQVNWIKSKGFLGVMVWALDLDDFSGTQCGQGKYPLLKHINDVLGGSALPTSIQPP